MEMNRLDPPVGAIQLLDDLLAAPKFLPDGVLYTGIRDAGARQAAEAIVNDAIVQVRELLRGPVSAADVLAVFREQLRRFDLSDTEDRECAAGHFEQIMDCVGLESSEGLLGEFVYDLDL